VTDRGEPPITTDEENQTVTVDAEDTTAEVAENVDEDPAENSEELTEADAENAELAEDAVAEPKKKRFDGSRVLAFMVLPAMALLLAGAAGYLKWQDSTVRDADAVRIESLQVAKDATVRILSYKPDTVEQDLGSARDLLTGNFRDSYTQLINDVVIPGARDKKISAVANVPAAASVSATPSRAEVLVFVNQTVIVGDGAPTATASSVKVTLDRVGDGWLISEFDPV
jgi:Mce-associated membrane protein